ncbi:MAG: helix-turn-helix domain-containing protein [Patescibacteria group bacterium]
MGFKQKELSNKTLGERLKGLREEAGLTLESLSDQLGITLPYLQFLEEGRYERLPGEIYIISFLKKYAQALRINEDKVLKLYKKERQVTQQLEKKGSGLYLPPKSKVNFSPFNPKFFRNLIIAFLVLGILIYLSWELTHVMSSPSLKISYPPEKFTTQQENIVIAGQTEPEVKVLVNGKEVYVDTKGAFSEEIILKEGVNVIDISAYKKQGKETTITREILYQINK